MLSTLLDALLLLIELAALDDRLLDALDTDDALLALDDELEFRLDALLFVLDVEVALDVVAVLDALLLADDGAELVLEAELGNVVCAVTVVSGDQLFESSPALMP